MQKRNKFENAVVNVQLPYTPTQSLSAVEHVPKDSTRNVALAHTAATVMRTGSAPPVLSYTNGRKLLDMIKIG